MNGRAGLRRVLWYPDMSRTESRPTNINDRAKGKRTESGLNPGSFAAYLSDAPETASFKEVAQAYGDGVEPADLPGILGGDS